MSLDPFQVSVPFIDTLPRPARAVFSFLEPLAMSGLSPTAVHHHLIASGFEIGLGSVRKAFALINTARDNVPYIDRLGGHALPDPSRLGPTLTNTLRRYSYTVVTSGVNSATGETLVLHTTISSSVLLTKSDAIDRAEAMIMSDPSRYPIGIGESNVVRIQRNPPYSI